MKILFVVLLICFTYQVCDGQEVGDLREVKLILVDVLQSGDAIQANFITPDSAEIFSFTYMDWLDQHVSLFDFFQSYKDAFSEKQLYFNATMVFIPREQYEHVRYEGYFQTGVFAHQWVLTSIVPNKRGEVEPTIYSEYKFDTVISTVTGDLNKDGLLDVAMITQDTNCPSQMYLLEVFFTQPNGDRKLVLTSIKAIEPGFPDGRDGHKSEGHSTLSIHHGVLWIETGFIRGHMEHKFRYQNGQFELIGYSYVNVNAGQITSIDYNLSTGRRIEKEGTISDDHYKVTMDEIIKLDPLPYLDEFEPYKNQLY